MQKKKKKSFAKKSIHVHAQTYAIIKKGDYSKYIYQSTPNG